MNPTPPAMSEKPTQYCPICHFELDANGKCRVFDHPPITQPPPQPAVEESSTPQTDARFEAGKKFEDLTRLLHMTEHAEELERELAALRPSPVATAGVSDGEMLAIAKAALELLTEVGAAVEARKLAKETLSALAAMTAANQPEA